MKLVWLRNQMGELRPQLYYEPYTGVLHSANGNAHVPKPEYEFTIAADHRGLSFDDLLRLERYNPPKETTNGS